MIAPLTCRGKKSDSDNSSMIVAEEELEFTGVPIVNDDELAEVVVEQVEQVPTHPWRMESPSENFASSLIT